MKSDRRDAEERAFERWVEQYGEMAVLGNAPSYKQQEHLKEAPTLTGRAASMAAERDEYLSQVQTKRLADEPMR